MGFCPLFGLLRTFVGIFIGLAGFRDWRLPSAAELQVLVALSNGPDRRLFEPPADAQGYPWYCSGTLGGDGDACQTVSTGSGKIMEASGGRVRLVRAENPLSGR